MNLGIFFEVTADGDSVWWQSLASGLSWTLSTALFAGLIAFFLGSVLGVARTTSRPWLVRLGNAYVELFRNIPLIVQFFLWYFVIPGLIPAVKRWVTTLLQAGKEAAAAGMDLKAAMAHTRKSMDPVFGHVFIYEHCLPFDVSRAYDEASGIKNPRIWTAERDLEMWKALQS